MIYFTDMRSGQTYLVSIARISVCGFPADDFLRELARYGIGYRLVNVSGTCNTHGLVHIASS